MSKIHQQYTETLEKELVKLYFLSEKARKKGIDPDFVPEIKIAKDLADLVEGLVGPLGVAEDIRELSVLFQREELAFKIAKAIVSGKYGQIDSETAAEQAIRTGLAILTEGLTAAPLQGVVKVKIKANFDQTHYLAIYFAGPIRSAGGTDQALTLVLGDFIRQLLGLDRFKPTEEELSRFTEEIRLYERSVGRFQYRVSDEELRKALKFLTVEVTGTETDRLEVSSFKNLPRVETNRLRGGALRVVNDGIIGRSSKVFAIIDKLGISGWDWLNQIRTNNSEASTSFMDDVIAGRPVFSFPSNPGGFRLRYGRARNTGLAAVGVHPITMAVLQDFIATGTQLRLELPGKGGIAVPVDVLEPPVARLQDGSVVRVSVENFRSVKDKIDKILFLGDILISFGDFLYNNDKVVPSGYVEEWWVEDLKQAIEETYNGNFENLASKTKIQSKRLKTFSDNAFYNKPNIKEALALSSKLNVPLHPFFVFFWSNLKSIKTIKILRKWLFSSKIVHKAGFVSQIIGENKQNEKRFLELIRLPHKVESDKIIIEGEFAHAFALCLRYNSLDAIDTSSAKTVLEVINLLSGIQIKEKAPTFVGARMGRPEKAKRREMKPLVHVLFPVGLAGGSKRNIVKAAKEGPIFVELVKYKCPFCKTYTSYIKCPTCGQKTIVEKFCPKCNRNLKSNVCPFCRVKTTPYQKQVINFKTKLKIALTNLGVFMPKVLKGVKGLTNELKIPEIIEKGILRAKYNLSVYKDGTLRFDITNAPLTHFKPLEIGVSVEKLRQLGYTYDAFGAPLTRENQLCELKIQDVIVPIKCAKYFLKIVKFLDELLSKVYTLSPYYSMRRFEELVGHLIIGLAPHTSVGVLGRIIGFTDLNVCYAHPIWHSAKRRDCDGDEDTLLVALDALLNFSRKYLPAKIGGIMDAPLLLVPIVNPQEVQRQAHDIDVSSFYPSKFFERTWDKCEPKQISPLIDLVGNRLGTELQFEGFNFTTPISNINLGNADSAYKQFKSMVEKLTNQLSLAEKLEAVDAKKVALKVLTKHFLPDIIGNLRAFSTQSFRCKSCNKRFRRLPLNGRCSSCDGKLTVTVYRGGIEKYLQVAQNLIEKFELPEYYSQRIFIVQEELSTLFENQKHQQTSMSHFV